MIGEEKHNLQLPYGIKLFYTLSRNGIFATVTLDLTRAEFKLSEADQEALAKLPNSRKHRRGIYSEKAILRVLRKDLPDVLDVILRILNRHINEGNRTRKGNTLKPEKYTELERALDTACRTLAPKQILYYPPICPDPKCMGLLEMMFGSKNQICCKCGKEWVLTEYQIPP